jgi:hypothetical protein
LEQLMKKIEVDSGILKEGLSPVSHSFAMTVTQDFLMH